MGDTTLFDLRYPGLNDSPHGPQAFQFLAEDVDGWLSSAFPCTSGTRPTPVSNRPMIIRETDTGNVLIWNGSAWVTLAGGGAGGFTSIEGQWRASSAQSIPSGADTVVALGTQETASSVVTRATSGAGHSFTLSELGAYAINFTGRFADSGPGRKFFELRNAAQTIRYPGASVGSYINDDPSTWSFSTVLRLPAATALVVVAAQTTGSGVTLEHQGSSIVDGFVRLNIVKIAS